MKPATKTTAAHKAPRPSIGRVADRGTSQVKPKSTALRPHSEKSQALNKEPVSQKDGPKPVQEEQESEKENIVEPTPSSPKETAPVKPAQAAAVEQPEAVAEPVEESAAPSQIEESTPEVVTDSNEKSVETPEPIIEDTSAETSVNSIPVDKAAEVLAETETPAEAHIEDIPEDAEEEKAAETAATSEPAESSPAQPKETVEEPVLALESTTGDEVKSSEKKEIFTPELDVVQTSESTDVPVEVSRKNDTISAKDEITPAPSAEPNMENTTEVELTEETPAEVKSEEPIPAVQPATEAESSNVALDITNLALN